MRAQFQPELTLWMVQGGLGEGFGAVSLGMLWIVSTSTFFLIWFSCPDGSIGIERGTTVCAQHCAGLCGVKPRPRSSPLKEPAVYRGP